jgi:hypothetical protein
MPNLGPYIAVWPDDTAGPGLDGPLELDGVVLAEVHEQRCFVCGTRFLCLCPEAGLPVLGGNLVRHRLVRQCPACGATADDARLHVLEILESSTEVPHLCWSRPVSVGDPTGHTGGVEIAGLVVGYRVLALDYGSAATGDTATRNMLSSKMGAIARRVRPSPEGRKALSALLRDSEPVVRYCAAWHCFAWDERSAVEALRSLSQSDEPLAANAKARLARLQRANLMTLSTVPRRRRALP